SHKQLAATPILNPSASGSATLVQENPCFGTGVFYGPKMDPCALPRSHLRWSAHVSGIPLVRSQRLAVHLAVPQGPARESYRSALRTNSRDGPKFSVDYQARFVLSLQQYLI
ncbi:MAG: hypothetical protein ABJA02_02140, partial [Acidobacteriota bacterium]